MVDTSALKRSKKTHITPPPPDEVGQNIRPTNDSPLPTASYPPRAGNIGRRSDRTLQLNLRVSPAFDTKLREFAAREGCTFAEVLERALIAYEASKHGS
jgi:hypothetical protein